MMVGAQIVFGLMVIVGLLLTLAMASEFLEAYLWQRRLLVVFAVASDDRLLALQLAAFTDRRQEADERQLSLVTVVGRDKEAVVTVDGQVAAAPAAAAVRARFGVEPGEFRALLVGKDGEVKLSDSRPLDMDELFAAIDAMPMRRRELQEQQAR